MFNCSFTIVETVYDIVDVLWLLLQGCGVGFKPITGTLNGFYKPIHDIKVVHTNRTGKGGREENLETWDPDTRIWTLSVGDSAEAWARSVGKLLAGKYPAERLILDFSEIRYSTKPDISLKFPILPRGTLLLYDDMKSGKIKS